MIQEASLEQNQTNGEHLVLSVVFDRKNAIRVNLYGGETSHDILQYVKKKFAVNLEEFNLLEVICNEIFELGAQTWTPEEARIAGIPYSKIGRGENTFFKKIPHDKREAFNSKWRIFFFKNVLKNSGIVNKLTYEEALEAIQEFIVIDPVLNS